MFRLGAFAGLQQGQLMGQQFVQRQSLLEGMLACFELFEPGAGRRMVEKLDGFPQVRLKRCRCLAAGGEGRLAERAHARLTDAVHQRVHRRQPVGQGWCRICQQPVLRVVELQTSDPLACLAETAQPLAGLQLGALLGGKVEQSDSGGTGAILDPATEAAAPPPDHIRQPDLAFHHRALAHTQCTDGRDAGTILVAQWQQEQQVLHPADLEPFESLRQRRAHAPQPGHGGAEVFWCLRSSVHLYSLAVRPGAGNSRVAPGPESEIGMFAGARIGMIGLGDIGGGLAQRLAADGAEVIGVRRGSEVPAGVQLVQADASDPQQLAALPSDLRWLVICVTPDDYSEAGYRNSYLAIAEAAARWAAEHRPERLFWVSSTSVYGPGTGEWVDETTTPRPERAQARVLLAAEQALAAGGCPVTVLRLAGIYGPGRVALLQRVLQGRGVPATPPQWTNRVHRDDAVAMLRFLLARAAGGREVPELLLGCDPNPTPRHEVLTWLRSWLEPVLDGLPPLQPDPDERIMPGRRLQPVALQQLGYQWHYPDYRAGFGAMLAAMQADGSLERLYREVSG